ncbi:MAG: M15 family metallopeptidase [Pseudomonadota bacterium]
MSRAEVRSLCGELGITPQWLKARGLPFHIEARHLTPVGLGTDGRDKLLHRPAARAWLKMRSAAAKDGIELLLVSAFRSYAFQAALIRGKLQRGIVLDDVLRINAPPGYSEHHAGHAVDIGSADCGPLEEAFEHTAAFAWLTQHAGAFGFVMSYPRGNAEGFSYEPWHWCWRASLASQQSSSPEIEED